MAELSLTGVCAGYAQADVLHDITLQLVAGQLHAVLGSNGTGKTTLLRTLAGLLPLRAGNVEWLHDGNRVCLQRLNARQRAAYIAYVPQVAGNDIPLTVHEAVELAGRAAIASRHGGQTTAALIASLQLEQYADVNCSALSGGLWRRVLLAQGLAQRTPILLLDEPTAFLDPPARQATLRLLRTVAASLGLCIICVLHDPQLALEFAHRAVALANGRVLASGPTAQVVTPVLLELLYRASSDLPCSTQSEAHHAA